MSTLSQMLANKAKEAEAAKKEAQVTPPGAPNIQDAATGAEATVQQQVDPDTQSQLTSGMNAGNTNHPARIQKVSYEGGIQHAPERKGQFLSLRQKSVILSDGRKFRPDAEGYFKPETPEEQYALQYLAKQNRGLVEEVL